MRPRHKESLLGRCFSIYHRLTPGRPPAGLYLDHRDKGHDALHLLLHVLVLLELLKQRPLVRKGARLGVVVLRQDPHDALLPRRKLGRHRDGTPRRLHRRLALLGLLRVQDGLHSRRSQCAGRRRVVSAPAPAPTGRAAATPVRSWPGAGCARASPRRRPRPGRRRRRGRPRASAR